MARMNLKLRRDAPGASVFWMVLGVGAAVLLVVGVYLYATGSETRVEPEGPAVITEEGDEASGTTGFSEGEVAEPETPPALPGEPGEVDVSVPETGEASDTGEAEPEGTADDVPAPPADGDEEADDAGQD